MTRFFAHLSARRLRASASAGAALLLWLSQLASCSENSPPPPATTGQACSAVDQCYPHVAEGTLMGDAVCLDRVEGGYCTHLCTADTDCCAVEGECAGAYAEVCSPIESAAEMYCFLSCEDADLEKTTITDADQYCSHYAGPGLHCRSTGGGAKNRKVCLP